MEGDQLKTRKQLYRFTDGQIGTVNWESADGKGWGEFHHATNGTRFTVHSGEVKPVEDTDASAKQKAPATAK